MGGGADGEAGRAQGHHQGAGTLLRGRQRPARLLQGRRAQNHCFSMSYSPVSFVSHY